jgi:CBS domain-containing protein
MTHLFGVEMLRRFNMPTIYDLVKDRETYFVEADQTVLEAAKRMVEHAIGAVPVLRNGELVGIFSERDIMKRVVAEQRDPSKTKLSEVMTANPLVVDVRESIEKCMLLMKEHNFRHLPICDGKKLKGLVSLRDMLLRDLTEKDAEVKMMRAYIHSGPSAD